MQLEDTHLGGSSKSDETPLSATVARGSFVFPGAALHGLGDGLGEGLGDGNALGGGLAGGNALGDGNATVRRGPGGRARSVISIYSY